MEYTLNNLGVSTENTVAAESSIRDSDMAWGIMQLMQKNLLMQASQSMMAQGMNLSRQNMIGLMMR
jgi:flagellin